MWNHLGLIVLLLEPVFAVEKANNVRTAEIGMHQMIHEDQSRSVSVDSSGRLAAVAAVRHSQTTATVYCEKVAVLEGCMCEKRPIGQGITGNFVNDSVTFESFTSSKVHDSFWDYTGFQYGEEVLLSKFKNKLTLVANVASA